MIKVRQATLADTPAIFKFLRKAYPENGRYKFPERWEWQFINNPFKPDNDLPVWIAIDEQGIVAGQSCAMYEPIKIGSNTCRLAWALDAYVLPEYRGQKLGFKVLEANCRSHDLWMGLVMADSSRHILTKLGCRPTDTVPVYRHIARMDTKSLIRIAQNNINTPWLKKHITQLLQLQWVDQFVTSLNNLRMRFQSNRFSRAVDLGIEIKHITCFDENINTLWNRISPQFDVIVQRTKAFLNWKYFQQPFINYQVFTASRNNQLCGYIIIRRTASHGISSGLIADLFVSRYDENTIVSLLLHAINFFYDNDVNNIYAASSIREYIVAFKTLGFKQYKEAKPLLFCNKDEKITEIVFSQKSWFLGRSDHDWDQVLHD